MWLCSFASFQAIAAAYEAGNLLALLPQRLPVALGHAAAPAFG